MTREEALQRIVDNNFAGEYGFDLQILVDCMATAREMILNSKFLIEDTISRQTAIDAFEKFIHELGIEDEPYNYGEMALSVKNVSPVIPQPKIGHWLIVERSKSDREVICSNCKQPVLKYHKLDCDYRPKYCPNCGYRMHD